MNGTLAGIIAILMWSSMACLVFFTGDVPGLFLAATTFFLGVITITSYQFLKREDIRSYWVLPRKDYFFVIMGTGVYTSLLYTSFKLVTPFEANTLNYLWPILFLISTSFIYKTGFSIKTIIGSFLGFCGAVSLFFPRDGQMFFANFEWGHLLAILAAVVWAIYSALARDRHYPQGIMAPVFLYSAFISFGFHFLLEETILPQGWQWFFIVILGVFRISYSFWDYAMKKGDVILLASLSNFVPLLSLFFLMLAGAGPENVYISLSAFFVVVGCLIVNFDKILILFNGKKNSL